MPSTSTRRSVEDQELPLTGIANSVPPQVARHHILEAILAKCGQFPLENASLNCTIDNGKPVFQLQCNLPPRLLYGCIGHITEYQTKSSSLQPVSKTLRVTAARERYTSAEDDLLLKLKLKENLPWPKVHQRFCKVFPKRSIGSLQVHYSTKVKPRETP